MSQQSVFEQTNDVRMLLEQTRKRQLSWEPSDVTSGAFIARRKGSSVVLGVDHDSPRLWVKFAVDGRPDWDKIIRQELPDAEPFDEEEVRDSLIARLHQIVTARVDRQPDAAQFFLSDDGPDESEDSVGSR